MGKGSPEAPTPPDYAAANREGIYADIETLPLRRLIESASSGGRKIQYQTPKQLADYNAALAAARDTTPINISGYQSSSERKAYQKALERGGDVDISQYISPEKYAEYNSAIASRVMPDISQYQTTADFTGLGDIDKAKMLAQMALETSDLSAQSQLDIGRKYGPQFQDLAIEALKRQDPEGYAGRQDLAAGLRRDYAAAAEPTESPLAASLRSQAIGLAQQTPGYETGDTDALRQAREAVLGRSLSEYALGSQLSGQQQQQVEQAVRGAAAARGQTLGNAQVMREVLQKYNAGEQLGQQRLSNLMNVGAQVFGQETALAASKQQQAQARLANLFNAQGTQFGQEQALRQETQQQQQRRLANLQSYTLGAPISSQFQSLQGAQQSGAPYSPIMAQGIGQAANAGQLGSSFAGNIFGTQAQIYNTQMANQSDPFGAIAGGLIGSFTGGLGSGLAKKVFEK